MADTKLSALDAVTSPLSGDLLYLVRSNTSKQISYTNLLSGVLSGLGITPTVTELNYVDGVTSAIQTQLDGKQSLDTDLTTIAGLSPSNNDILQRKSGAWANRTMTQLKTDLSLSKSDVGLGNVDNTSDSTKNSATATLTNKRVKRRVSTNTSVSTLTPEKDSFDEYILTAQAEALTIANHSTSTLNQGDLIEIRIKDNGTARAITFGTEYRASSDLALPTTTTVSKTLYMLFEWNSTDSKMDLLAVLDNF